MPPTLTAQQQNQQTSTGRTLGDVFKEVRGNGGLDVQSAVLPTQATSFSVDVPNTIPTTALTSNTSPQDVLRRRADAERQQVASLNSQQGFDTFLSTLNGTGNQNDVNSVISSFIFNAPQTQVTQQRDQLLQQSNQDIQNIRDVTQNRTSQADRFQELQQESGLPVAQDRLASVSEEIANLTGDFSRFTAGLENEAGQTRVGFEARLNPAQRQYIAELGALSALQQALQGNVTAAQQNIDRVLELEFRDEQQAIDDAYNQLNLTQAQISNLEPQLQEEANRRAQALQLALQRRQEILSQQQQDRAQALQYAMIAGQNGAPASVVRQIAGAETPEAALGLSGGYLEDPSIALQRESLDLQYLKLARDQQAAALEALQEDEKEGKRAAATFRKADLVIDKVDDVLGRVNNSNAGINSVFGLIPGTPQRNLKKDIETIKANIGFEALQEMRENSPTGGALGQVAVLELEFLQATLGNLDTSQTAGQLKSNLEDVKSHFQNLKAVIEMDRTGEVTLLDPRTGQLGKVYPEELEQAFQEGYIYP